LPSFGDFGVSSTANGVCSKKLSLLAVLLRFSLLAEIHGMRLVAHNVPDFQSMGDDLLNPWD